MPIFKVTVREQVTRETVAYVEAPDASAADRWAAQAEYHLFREVGEEDVWAEIDSIDQVETAPDNWTVRTT